MAWRAWGLKDPLAWCGCQERTVTTLDLLGKVGEMIKYDLQVREDINEVGLQAREGVGKGFPEMIQIQLS